MATPGRFAENIVHFARVLRRAGLRVGPRQVLDAVEAVEAAGIGTRQDFYWTLHATLVKRHEEHELFDQAFHVFWRDPQLLDKMMSLMLPEMATPPEASEEERSRRLAEALFGESRSEPLDEPDIEIDGSETFSAEELLRVKDFEQMSGAELAEAKAAIARLHFSHDDIRTRRTKPAARGHMVDMRATLRATLRSGGIIPLKRRDSRRSSSFAIFRARCRSMPASSSISFMCLRMTATAYRFSCSEPASPMSRAS